MRAAALATIVLPAMLAVGCSTAGVVSPISDRYGECDAPELADAERALARGEIGLAVRAYRTVVESCPLFVPGHERFQDLSVRAGADAEARMRAYYASWPDDGSPVWPYAMGRLEGEFDERRKELLEEALSRDPSFYHASLGLARMWHGLGRTQNELEALESAIQAKPDAPETNLALARVLTELGRIDEAAPHFRNYLEQRPGDREAAREFVRLLLYGKRDPAAARPWVERLREDDAEDTGALMDAAALEWLRGESEAAAELYRRVLVLEPDSARALLNLGNLYFLTPDRPDDAKRRDWPRAREAYRAFLEIADPQELQDLLDVYTAVPARLARIDEFLGAEGATTGPNAPDGP